MEGVLDFGGLEDSIIETDGGRTGAVIEGDFDCVGTLASDLGLVDRFGDDEVFVFAFRCTEDGIDVIAGRETRVYFEVSDGETCWGCRGGFKVEGITLVGDLTIV